MTHLTSKSTLQSLAHWLVLCVGAAVLVGGAFQNSLWFDEAYSVGLMQHSFTDILRISVSDVHPSLYYLLLKAFCLVFGTSLPVMRLFSVLGMALLALLGWTHIRRDFGAEIGFWFSFVTLTLASTLTYALQIRMYSWAALFVALAAIYAWRSVRDPKSRKNHVLFVLCAVAAAYTHYFGLFTVAGMNLLMLWQVRHEKSGVRTWLIRGAVELAAYLPGAAVMVYQAFLNGASWILIEWPDLIFDFISYPFLGDVLKISWEKGTPSYYIAGVLFFSVAVAFGFSLRRTLQRSDIGKRAANACLTVYGGVMLFSLVISLVRPLYYIRYTVVLNGLMIFVLAFWLAARKHGWQKYIAALLLIGMFAWQAAGIYDLMYDASADNITAYLDDKVQKDDLFLLEDAGGFVVSVFYPENAVYCYNGAHWRVQNTYRAFGTRAEVLDELTPLDDYTGRIWLVGRGACYEYFMNSGNCTEISCETVTMRYHKSAYEIILLEKNA